MAKMRWSPLLVDTLLRINVCEIHDYWWKVRRVYENERSEKLKQLSAQPRKAETKRKAALRRRTYRAQYNNRALVKPAYQAEGGSDA